MSLLVKQLEEHVKLESCPVEKVEDLSVVGHLTKLVPSVVQGIDTEAEQMDATYGRVSPVLGRRRLMMMMMLQDIAELNLSPIRDAMLPAYVKGLSLFKHFGMNSMYANVFERMLTYVFSTCKIDDENELWRW